jgi:branched-chain amino acid transport system permease protein
MPELSRYLQFFFSGITMGGIYALMAVSLTIVYRVSKAINFVQGEFFMIGALTLTSFLAFKIVPFFLAIALSLALVAAVGILTEKVIIHPLREASIGIIVTMTIGASLFIKGLGMLIWGKEPVIVKPFIRMAPIRVGEATISPQALVILFTALVVVVFLWYFFEKTETGLAMRACAENRVGAKLVGINPSAIVTIAWVLGAALGALAGILITPLLFIDYLIGTVPMLKGFIAIAIGGLSSISGAIIGGILIGLIEAFSIGLVSSRFADVTLFGILILILTFRPGGIIGKEDIETGGM